MVEGVQQGPVLVRTFFSHVVCAVSVLPWQLFTGVCARCVVCAVSVASWRLVTIV